VVDLKTIIEEAKALGCSEVTVEGVTYRWTSQAVLGPAGGVPESKPEDLIKPLSTMDEPNEEDVLYWSTPYFDELQAKRADMAKRKKEGTVNGE
jgi:hypothetical protein